MHSGPELCCTLDVHWQAIWDRDFVLANVSTRDYEDLCFPPFVEDWTITLTFFHRCMAGYRVKDICIYDEFTGVGIGDKNWLGIRKIEIKYNGTSISPHDP